MKILIVDDEPLARERIREMLKKETGIKILEAENGGEAVKNIKTHHPDIVFLDIQMPDLDGFQVLEKLGEKILNQIPAIIFVTAFDQHALRAFEFHALDYLLKPFDRERFAETFRRAKAQIKNQSDDSNRRILNLLEQMNETPEYLEWLTIKKDERIRLFKTEDIHWIEGQGNYVLLKFAENSELLRETMDGIEAQLNPKMFVRIHRSAIINVNHIKELQVWRRGEYRVVMRGGKTFTLSRSYREKFDTFLKKRLI
jgi:two-component system LytT family response regulator